MLWPWLAWVTADIVPRVVARDLTGVTAVSGGFLAPMKGILCSQGIMYSGD